MNRTKLLVRFAASAPNEIPGWYQPENTPPRPKSPADPSGLGFEADQLIKSYRQDPCFDMRDAATEVLGNAAAVHILVEWAKARDGYREAMFEWEKACVEWRYFGWRYYYAAQMVRRFVG